MRQLTFHRLMPTLIVAAAMAGCASTTPQKSPEQQVSESPFPKIAAFSGKRISLNIDFRQKHEKKEQKEEFEIRPVERTKEKDMYQGAILQDARISLKTNDQLEFFERYVAHTLIQSGAVIVPTESSSDMAINATLTYGPTPAPAYRDYNFGKSLGMSLMTLGLGPRSYDSVVDYTISIELKKAETSIAAHSKIIKKNSEELKSQFNFNRGSDVQDSAIASFQATLQEQMTLFAKRIETACGSSC